MGNCMGREWELGVGVASRRRSGWRGRSRRVSRNMKMMMVMVMMRRSRRGRAK